MLNRLGVCAYYRGHECIRNALDMEGEILEYSWCGYFLIAKRPR